MVTVEMTVFIEENKKLKTNISLMICFYAEHMWIMQFSFCDYESLVEVMAVFTKFSNFTGLNLLKRSKGTLWDWRYRLLTITDLKVLIKNQIKYKENLFGQGKIQK